MKLPRVNTPPASRPARFTTLLAAGAILMLTGLTRIFWGEILPVNGGQGWDGLTYVAMAQDLPQVLANGVDSYRAGRILPSAIVYAVTSAAGIPKDAAHMRDTFAFYNLAMLLLTLVAWWSATRSAGVDSRGFWLGFVLVFLNFANLVMPFYYAPLTDATAMALAAWLVAFHLAGHGFLALITLILGMLTWPSFLFFGAPLVVFKARGLEPQEGYGRLGAAVGAGLCLLFVLEVWLRPRPADVREPRLFVLGVLVTLAYWFFVAHGLLGAPAMSRVRTWRDAVSAKHLAIFAITTTLAALALRSIASAPGFGMFYVFDRTAYTAVLEPGVFLVGHVVYFGLAIPLAIALWPALCQRSHELGLGFTLFLAANVGYAIAPESRGSIIGLPALVLAVVMASRTLRWPQWGVLGAAVLNLFLSKIWFTINTEEGFRGRSDPLSDPAQRYFMNHGATMTHESYLLQGSVGLALLLLAIWWRSLGKPQPNEENDRVFFLPPGAIRIGVVLAVALGLAGSIEVAVRILPVPSDANEVSSPADPRLGWRNPPGDVIAVRHPGYQTELRFNSLGLRGPEVPRDKTKDRRRVVVLGGSLIEGYNLAENETMPARLAQALDEPSRAAEVVNGGVASYVADQALLLLLSLRSQLAADEVVLALSARDAYLLTTTYGGKPQLTLPVDTLSPASAEFEPVTRPRRLYPRATRLKFRGSAALRRFSNLVFEKSPAWYRRLAPLGVTDRTEPPAIFSAFAAASDRNPIWKQTAGVLEAFSRVAQEDGAGLTVLYFPEPFEFDDDEWTRFGDRYDLSRRKWSRDRAQRALGNLSSALSIPLIDLTDSFRALRRSGREPYIAGEHLLSIEGSRAAALEIARILRSRASGGARK